MDASFYTNILYPLQDRVLRAIDRAETEFYLTGGTAASRGYLDHRFSDDLDLFVNDAPEFLLWAQRVIHALSSDNWPVEVVQKEDRFARILVTAEDVAMKIKMVNDVPAHTGQIRKHPVLGRLDSPENILANKITAALDREEPKDLADIWGFCSLAGLSLDDALRDAGSKAAGVFPADLARILCSVSRADYDLVRWSNAPEYERFHAELFELGEQLLIGR